MTSKVGRICISVGASLLCVALILCVQNVQEEAHAQTASQTAVAEIVAQLPTTPAQSTQAEPAPAATLVVETDVPTVQVAQVDYMGVLTLPTLGLQLPVQSAWSYDALQDAPCRYQGTVEEGLVIMAHNYNAHFGRLDELAVGDAITLQDAQGEVHAYTVAEVGKLYQTQVEEMIATDAPLTLFTCNEYDNTERIVVRCVAKNE